MTREQILQRAEVMAAWAKGAEAQWQRKNGVWEDVAERCGWGIEFPVRIKPMPKLQPWKREEVPLDAWFRLRDNDVWGQMTSINLDCACFLSVLEGAKMVSFGTLLETAEHSIDGGKTWLPCGVMEVGK